METPEPNYVYTTDGIFKVPFGCIRRDRRESVPVSSDFWKGTQLVHRSFTMSELLAGTAVRACHIVVLAMDNERDPHGPPARCHWFVRISVDGGSDRMRRPFGENFLWPMPILSCMQIIEELKAYEIMYNVPPWQTSTLIHELRPTRGRFFPKRWPGFLKLNFMDERNDKIFAMSLIPCQCAIPMKYEKKVPNLPRLVRPVCLQSKYRPFDFEQMSDDVVSHILKSATSLWLSSPHPCDWKALLSLRAVSKGAKEHVEREAGDFVKRLDVLVKQGLLTDRLCDTFRARDAILSAGLATIPFLLEKDDPTFFSLARLRSKRTPGTMPVAPPPPRGPRWGWNSSL